MLEQAEYPFVAGSHGIDFTKVNVREMPLTALEREHFIGRELTTGSHRKSLGFFTSTSIQIRDAENYHHIMNAFNDNGTVVFGIQTRDRDEKVANPDFMAAKFVAFALTNLQRFGKVEGIKGIWHYGTTNFEMYAQARAKGLSRVDSAMSTWTGRVVSQNGFVLTREDQVQYVIERFFGETIRATFTHPQ